MPGKKAKLAAVKPLRIVQREPDPQIIELLEGFLADAKAGILTNVAIIAVLDGGTIRSGFCCNGACLTQIIGGAEFLKAEMMAAAIRAKKEL